MIRALSSWLIHYCSLQTKKHTTVIYLTFFPKDTKTGFPLGLENLENLEKWEGIFQSGKSQGILMRLEKSGKSQGKSHKILENWRNFRQMLFVTFQWQLNKFVYYLLNLIKFSVKKTISEKLLENGKKYWKSQGKVREFCQSGKVGTLS